MLPIGIVGPVSQHTIRRVEAPTSPFAPFPEELRRSLSEHYRELWMVRLEKRIGSDWQSFAEIDVGAAEPDVVLSADVIDEAAAHLAEDVELSARGESTADGGLRIRVTGWKERDQRHWLFAHLWHLGSGSSTRDELNEEKRELDVMRTTNEVQLASVLARHLDRAYERLGKLGEMMLQQCVAAGTMSRDAAHAMRAAAEPLVELRKLELADGQKRLELQAESEQEDRNFELMMYGIETIAKNMEASAAAATKAKADAQPSGPANTPPPSEPPKGKRRKGKGGEPPRTIEPIPVVEIPRCSEAAELHKLVEALPVPNLARIRELFSADEFSALQAATRCATTAEFDQAFGRMYDLQVKRGESQATALHAQVVPLLGMSALTLQRLIAGYERRSRRTTR